MTDFVKKIKLPELENKISDVSNLATNTALTTVDNKMPDVTNLVKKQIIILNLKKLKIKSLIIIMINILQLQSLIIWLQIFLMRDYHKPIW